jgi:hypothetical protein
MPPSNKTTAGPFRTRGDWRPNAAETVWGNVSAITDEDRKAVIAHRWLVAADITAFFEQQFDAR